MKLIPGKYLFNENGELCIPREEFMYPLWDYIEMNLQTLHISEKEIIELFDITPSALSNWKNGSKQISLDKLVILCSMFGVTIDEMLEREYNDDYQNEFHYELNMFFKNKEYKTLTFQDLSWFVSTIARAEFYIQYYPLGYIPFEKDPDDPIDFPDKEYIGVNEVRYLCQNLDINIIYSTRIKENIEIESISYDELKQVTNELRESWKEEAYNYITVNVDKKYKDIILLSENHKFLKHYIEMFPAFANEYLSIWSRLKLEDSNYDKNNIMAKVLLANDAKVFVNGEESPTETMELYRRIIKDDINNLKEDK